MGFSILRHFEKVNKELWLLLSIFVIALLLNRLADSQRLVLSFYTLPTVAAAYLYGRRHATLTAFGSVLIVVLLAVTRRANFDAGQPLVGSVWLDLLAWGSMLIITGHLMGSLYDLKNRQLKELRQTYDGVLVLLRHFISKDEYTEHHSYRVAEYAVRIGARMNLSTQRLEDLRASGLLHDIGKLDVSRELLYKAAQFTKEEFEEIQRHVERGVATLETVGGSLRRVIPIVLAHHDKFDGSGYHPTKGENIPLEARILSVADVFDSLTSDRPYRKAMSPFEARDIIVEGSGRDFDPNVVEAFLVAFRNGELEAKIPVVAA